MIHFTLTPTSPAVMKYVGTGTVSFPSRYGTSSSVYPSGSKKLPTHSSAANGPAFAFSLAACARDGDARTSLKQSSILCRAMMNDSSTRRIDERNFGAC